ncbi:DUF6473 family protein [Puniceibacterium confluentis]|uniref:DUF6473 family protein n=1 Tax=Puniceibacterium confluentis TaxID=1958944 RepID=UPI0011B47AD0|nr:DUF6473 family protein [Puniceibacterium confluentis]
MSFAMQGQGGLEYYPCRYGKSRVLFRGPRRRLRGEYLAFLGGTETYGRFISTPYTALVERLVNRSCVNFGSINAGIDLYLQDPAVLEAVAAARLNVIQVMGAQNMSNRFYSVHPRRNDRFLRASPLLHALYPDADFTEFHFNRHLLRHLRDLSEERFEMVALELRAAWLSRMKYLLGVLRGQSVLLWFAQSPPGGPSSALEGDPLFVDSAMIEALRPRLTDIVIAPPSRAALDRGSQGMVFSDFDACAAAELMGPEAHEEVAAVLGAALAPLLRPDRPPG